MGLRATTKAVAPLQPRAPGQVALLTDATVIALQACRQKAAAHRFCPRRCQALLLHGNREVCAPGKVNLVANLHFIEHRRIGDTSAVFPTVRPNEAD
jgi:hypothetical protein